jgi:hypothetical protein
MRGSSARTLAAMAGRSCRYASLGLEPDVIRERAVHLSAGLDPHRAAARKRMG